jgi:hypothetical protein
MPLPLVTLRDAQLEQLGAAMMDEFQLRLLVHARTIFPKRTAALGDAGARALIRKAVGRAQELRITTERGVTRFADLMFAFGDDFETRSGLAWMVSILQDRSRSEDARLYLVWIQLPQRCPTSLEDA